MRALAEERACACFHSSRSSSKVLCGRAGLGGDGARVRVPGRAEALRDCPKRSCIAKIAQQHPATISNPAKRSSIARSGSTHMATSRKFAQSQPRPSLDRLYREACQTSAPNKPRPSKPLFIPQQTAATPLEPKWLRNRVLGCSWTLWGAQAICAWDCFMCLISKADRALLGIQNSPGTKQPGHTIAWAENSPGAK